MYNSLYNLTNDTSNEDEVDSMIVWLMTWYLMLDYRYLLIDEINGEYYCTLTYDDI